MSVTVALSNLAESIARFRQSWTSAQGVWLDESQHEFAKNYLDPLETKVRSVQREMQNLADVIANARREVR